MRRTRLRWLLLLLALVALVLVYTRTRPTRGELIYHHLRLGDAATASQPDQAISEYQAALALDPCVHYARRGLARVYDRMGDHPGAIHELEAGVRADPRSVMALDNLAFAHYAARNFRAAIPVYRAAAHIEPDNAYWLTFVGRCYAGLGDAPSARKEFAAVLRVDPNNTAARRGLDVLNDPHRPAAHHAAAP
jgi:tetratricopeptide (TPR) repeat protein